ncbi:MULTISPECIES: hypothetical protein [Pontibacillus]|uniref:Uncharacterized protein n=1 Tax=Pontibacillus chungwhensis TaxID=265426 RepID=A0ABY8V2V0_9BACI|nr:MULTISPECIES: hypothetical protein [Pontibacillus]MCD5326151.1 hypothetical protein [Pontibacillus sp. HN14]WIG00291.1 hypothetical protein QNI29_21025 [Pontibacillus chungwhensis]
MMSSEEKGIVTRAEFDRVREDLDDFKKETRDDLKGKGLQIAEIQRQNTATMVDLEYIKTKSTETKTGMDKLQEDFNKANFISKASISNKIIYTGVGGVVALAVKMFIGMF